MAPRSSPTAEIVSRAAPEVAAAGSPWHALDASAVLTRWRTSAAGLVPEDARRRLAEHGPNELRHEPPRSILCVLGAQLRSFLVWLLIAAALFSGLLGEWIDAVAIARIVLLNAGIGAAQELRAERSIAALKPLGAPRARVRRGGRAQVVPAAELVPGDVLELEAGDLVAADARLLESASLACVEKALTGESEAVVKDAAACLPSAGMLADRKSMVYLGTAVATGWGLAVVVATGMPVLPRADAADGDPDSWRDARGVLREPSTR